MFFFLFLKTCLFCFFYGEEYFLRGSNYGWVINFLSTVKDFLVSMIFIKKSAFLIFPLLKIICPFTMAILNIFFLSLVFRSFTMWCLNAYFFEFTLLEICNVSNYLAWSLFWKIEVNISTKLLFSLFIFYVTAYDLISYVTCTCLYFPPFYNFFLTSTWLLFLTSSSSLILSPPVSNLLFVLYFIVICIILFGLRISILFMFIDSGYLVKFSISSVFLNIAIMIILNHWSPMIPISVSSIILFVYSIHYLDSGH